jgi:hypothetical protein
MKLPREANPVIRIHPSRERSPSFVFFLFAAVLHHTDEGRNCHFLGLIFFLATILPTKAINAQLTKLSLTNHNTSITYFSGNYGARS